MCDGAYNRIVTLYGYGRYIYIYVLRDLNGDETFEKDIQRKI